MYARIAVAKEAMKFESQRKSLLLMILERIVYKINWKATREIPTMR